MSDATKTLPKQPEVNIGTIGHVDHGKTTLVQVLTGTWASRHSEELKRGITIKLGYADMPIYRCPKCPPPKNYTIKPVCEACNSEAEFARAISFVDAPGHEALMATMLSGVAIMDGAILVIAADEPCPQAQTREHLAAAEVSGVKNIIIVQNKIDIVDQKRALESYKEIKAFVKGTVAENAPIIPISAQRGINIDVLLEAIQTIIPTPKRDPNLPPLMYIIRSFDINKPGTTIDGLEGGIIGGTIAQGKFAVGEEIEIRPGIVSEREGKTVYNPLISEIVSLHSGIQEVKEATCGGLIGVGTLLDPSYSKADGLTGSIVGKTDQLPPIVTELTLETHVLERVVGTKELLKVEKINPDEALLLHVGAAVNVGKVINIKQNTIKVKLTRPICALPGSRVAISRKITARWRLIGYGFIK
ncbi:translation initiation factor IF-2 subunit gamma [Candidatus Bathycorpusculum sp.]|jgi:translation initiation factor 2 subunit 3|uniref:translation initiation factor IF-2 subunit gamma n=1 Tax=Candidatus Bathycorpusculum sp. TaxID=2994959 RepID=UPI002827FB41|nr:translation initiation factor IF-2 subunit gamma [Candidatus Termitimicrobium sp.]MCL2431266.1 translation initiation factor IF-2 subunit gamma [Candidatus Termitimicrobium sp.]